MFTGCDTIVKALKDTIMQSLSIKQVFDTLGVSIAVPDIEIKVRC